MSGKLPEGWAEAMSGLQGDAGGAKAESWRPASPARRRWKCWCPRLPELVGGSADLTGSNLTLVKAWPGGAG
jgi:transketolase